MTARYAEVARSLARRIERSDYPVGSQLPPEVELAGEYAVSRATVRAALDSLERSGLVSRRRRLGTRVQAVRPTTGYSLAVTTMRELLQYSTETHRSLLGESELVVDDELADLVGWRAGTRLTHVRMLRLTDSLDALPLCHTDVYLLPEIAEKVMDRIAEPDGLINEIVEQRTGRLTDRVEQRIRARGVPAQLAEILQAEADSPALEIVRTYVESSGQISQVTVSVHPSDRFEFVTSMTRPSA